VAFDVPTAFVHPTEALLEEYHFNRLDEPALAPLEEHLLICQECRDQLQRLDDFVLGLREVTRSSGNLHPHFTASRLFHPSLFALFPSLPLHLARVTGMALAAVALTISVLTGVRMKGPLAQAEHVELMALRGGSTEGAPSHNVSFSHRGQLAKAPSGKPLELAIDQQRLPGGEGYLLRVVDSDGRETWSGPAIHKGSWLLARVGKGLRPGVYWARLYSETGTLMSEYGLEISPY
jgi:hypothetical protein